METKYIHTTPFVDFEIGAGKYDINVNQSSDGVDLPSFKREQTTGYLYLYPKVMDDLDLTWGFSYDDFSQGDFELDGAQPKFGVRWEIVDGLALRAAALETVKRALVVDQTIEPTQIAGFNQFFDDINGTETHRYGFGLDARFTSGVLGGAEYSWRDLNVPIGAPEPAFF
jgi:TonB dependent receptor